MTSFSQQTYSTLDNTNESSQPKQLTQWLTSFVAGLLLPLGFAPFHFPGLCILGIALLFIQLQQASPKQAFTNGLLFGLGFFGLGVSWIYISIHAYGHLPPLVSACITLLFILYLALFCAGFSFIYRLLQPYQHSVLARSLLFSTLWTLTEYTRAHLFTGFPWLLLGVGQFDAPLSACLPILGVYGTSWLAALAASWLANLLMPAQKRHLSWLIAFLLLILLPKTLFHHAWTQESNERIKVGIIQSNISMRDKWDEKLFWRLLKNYHREIKSLLNTDLIVLPESAIPLPAHYVYDYLANLDYLAKQKKTAILMGIPTQTHTQINPGYYNSLSSFGLASGQYLKEHLVPFGEYIPRPFQKISKWLGVDDPALNRGANNQTLIQVKHHPIASLICYELAYEALLLRQLPEADWIVSISDDGWFGHSLAMYQQQQIAQVRSLQTGRYQIVSNNDGLSAIVNTFGEIVTALPALSAGTLIGEIRPAKGQTPWSRLGDGPILTFLVLLFLLQSYKPLAGGLMKTLSLSTRFTIAR